MSTEELTAHTLLTILVGWAWFRAGCIVGYNRQRLRQARRVDQASQTTEGVGADER